MKIESRGCHRFSVPGATVRWRKRQLLSRGSTPETGCVLLDLSRGGCRFLVSRELRPGASLDLWIDAPDDPRPLCLRGRVLWSWFYPGERHQVGVGFDPYGDAEGANSPDALDRIAALEARYLRDASPNEDLAFAGAAVVWFPAGAPGGLSERTSSS